MEHENEHLDIREKLLRLPKLQADENFLKRLQIQIDILDSEEKTRDVVDKGSVSGYFKNLFGARLVPALGISSIVVVAVLAYFILIDNKNAVVDSMTGNKNQETIITHEKPADENSAPKTQAQDVVKNETNNTNETQKQNSSNTTSIKDKELTSSISPAPEVSPSSPGITTEKDISQNVSIDAERKPVGVEQSGRLISPDEIEKSGIRGITSLKSAKSVKGDTKNNSDDRNKSSEEMTSEAPKISAPPLTEQQQERTVKEGGRGISDSKKKANIKPKRRNSDGAVDINESVLETLRDKLK